MDYNRARKTQTLESKSPHQGCQPQICSQHAVRGAPYAHSGLVGAETISLSLCFLIFERGHFSAVWSRAVDHIRSCFWPQTLQRCALSLHSAEDFSIYQCSVDPFGRLCSQSSCTVAVQCGLWSVTGGGSRLLPWRLAFLAYFLTNFGV